jgi:hypothetical protein
MRLLAGPGFGSLNLLILAFEILLLLSILQDLFDNGLLSLLLGQT